ncbi:MAG TPA: C45 family peptidase [Bryobacteraceae bacterium]|nr:C45 family peptidase [Bryobacteraceae bacterium]
MSELKVLDLGSDARQRGTIHGREMRSEIRANYATYMERFETGGAKQSIVLNQSEAWAAFIARDNPEYAEEMAGIAAGANLSLTEIAMLNARYELAYCVFGSEAQSLNQPSDLEQDGCTSFGVMPEITASGHTLIGQNWDWLAKLQGRVFLMRVQRSSGPGVGKPDFIGFTEAGIAGCKIGVNEAGIGLCVNGLVTLRDGANAFRKPFHVRCREILDAWTFDKALLPVVQTDRTCSTNFLIAHADGEIINIEATPDYCSYLYPEEGLVTHANHLIKETRIASQFERLAPHSLYRANRFARLLRRNIGRIDLNTIHSALSDHFSTPASICRHPDTTLPEPKRVTSVTAAAIDLNARTLYVTDGPPCQSQFQAAPLHVSVATNQAD